MADQVDDLGIPIRPARPTAGITVPPRAVDLSHPGGEPVNALSRQPGSRDHKVDARTLVVGCGISISGKVTPCDRLIIEGRVESNFQNCRNMIIAETGIFRGNGSTENADVRGRVEGDLVVRKRLLIRAGGHVSGTITYGEIEIEAGGRISGVIQAHETANGLRTLKRS
jgi:cytoskeletal protein CcmA (bactofilin family)